MKFKFHFFFVAFILFVQITFAQKVKLVLTFADVLQVNNSLADESFYLASNLNSWSPNDKAYRFSKVNGAYELLINTNGSEQVEFKITRGSWQKVECDATGKDIQNRIIITGKDSIVKVVVQQWKDFFANTSAQESRSKHVQILTEKFQFKNLGTEKRVWMYLPKNYSSSTEDFKVLYMHDGQNLFDANTSAYGEWGIDECLDTMLTQLNLNLIVVGIDNGSDRLSEYSAFDFKVKADSQTTWDVKAKADLYLKDLIEQLIPYVEQNYRVQKSREGRYMAGSSMGGVLSLYAAMKYENYFTKAGVFSPAFWTARDAYQQLASKKLKHPLKVYMYAGELEGRTYVIDMFKIHSILMASKNIDSSSKCYAVPSGRHNELFWRTEFPGFVNWLSTK